MDNNLIQKLQEIKLSEQEQDLFAAPSEDELAGREEGLKKVQAEQKAADLARRKARGEEEEKKAKEAGKPIDLNVLFWKLVPGEGHADTVEGELVRAANRLIYRYYNDGDYYYKGYGRETAGPAAKFLKAKAKQLGIPELSKAFTAMSSSRETEANQFNGGTYDAGLKVLEKAIVDYVLSKNGQYTPNNEDMWDS